MLGQSSTWFLVWSVSLTWFAYVVCLDAAAQFVVFRVGHLGYEADYFLFFAVCTGPLSSGRVPLGVVWFSRLPGPLGYFGGHPMDFPRW